MSRARTWMNGLVAGLGVGALLLVSGCSADTDRPAARSSAAESVDPSGSAAATDPGSGESAPADPAGDPTTDAGDGPDPTGEASAAPSVEPAATTPVPAPQGGDINQTVAAVPVTTAPAVPLNSAADFGGGVRVEMVELNRIDTTAQGPGEVAGPGVAVKLRFVNDSSAAVSLDNVTVNLADGSQQPGLPMSAAPAQPFRGSVDAGATAEGVYVFTLPADFANPASVTVSYSAGAPTVVFTGDAP